MRKLVLVVVLFVFSVHSAAGAAEPPEERPRNIILFVADGGGPASFTMARDYIRDYLGTGTSLAVDSVLVGSIRTYSSDSRVTDSAAGATAFSAGIKTYNGAIAVDDEKRPVRTVLEEAEAKGMATGLVATSRITHATPAAFAAHVPDRGMEAEIAAQQMTKDVDVILGGGRRFFLPADAGGSRRDGRNLVEEARRAGYAFVTDREGLAAATATPLLGLFAMDHMAYEIDRDSLVEPGLEEMTTRAIDLLEEDEEGFFLMVEGSRIDHAAHANDPAAHLHDVLAYDRALAAALAWAREDGKTLVIAVSDHETGGLTLGRDLARDRASDEASPRLGRSLQSSGVYAWRPEAIARVTSSVEPMIDAMRSEGVDPADVLETYAGVDDLTEGERALLELGLAGETRLDHAIGEIISRRAVIGWTTGGHTAVDINVYAYGPGSERLRGNHENSYVGQLIATLLGLELDAVSDASTP